MNSVEGPGFNLQYPLLSTHTEEPHVFELWITLETLFLKYYYKNNFCLISVPRFCSQIFNLSSLIYLVSFLRVEFTLWLQFQYRARHKDTTKN